MADVNANIGVNIDTSNALAQLKALQRQISQFHTSIARSSETAGLAQRDLQKNFLNSINAVGSFSAELRTVKTTAESFTDSLEKNKFSMREYFRFAGASTKTFGKLFSAEFDTINKVAEQNVKRLQTQYVKMGRDASGAMRAIAIMPNELDMSKMSTQLQMAGQKQALFNQLVKQGSTNLLNFGKNTQWAGRQLMVGFTLPLASLGMVASRTFLSMETAAINFRKVYGDLFTPEAEREQALEDITRLGEEFTKYGIAVSDTVALSATAAAAGFAGLDLQRQTTEATRLSILGQVDSQKALTTTIALQNAFKISSQDMADSINFLNAVENQTVLSLDDITEAIPRVGPIIEQLGGNIKDLAFFLTAMKEGGVSAAQGSNALKSGLASLIAPSDKANAVLMSYGININKIVEGNQGNLRQTVIDFAQALDTLDPLNRSRAIEQLFGKFQFARISALFNNITTDGTQASRVLDLASASLEELAGVAESELAVVSDATGTQFKQSMEELKLALVPIGEAFLQAVTPILEFVGGVLERFDNLSSGAKKAIVVLTVAIGAIGPVALMTFGLLMNALANGAKGLLVLRQGYLRLTGQTQILGEQTDYLTVEQQRAAAVAHSLDQSHARLTQTFNAEAGAIRNLANEYRNALAALQQFAQRNPGMMMPPKKYNKGVVVVPGSGNKDTVPAMLTPGEAVIPADMTQKYGALINGMIAGNIPGYQKGLGYQGQTYSIPMSEKTTQSAIVNVLSKFSKDVEGISLALEFLEQQAKELGAEFGMVGADRLKKLFDELGVQRNRPKGVSASNAGDVFAHAQERGPSITNVAEIERLVNLANTTEKGIGKYLNATLEVARAGEQAATTLAQAQQEEILAQQQFIDATSDADRQAAQAKILAAQEAQKLAQAIITASEKARVYALSNFGFILPKGANKGEFSPAQLAEQFQGPNVSKTMAPVYSEYARQLGMTLDQALNNPQISAQMHQDVEIFSSRIAAEIGDATSGFVDDPTFYAAVERARAGLGDAVTSILHNAITEMKKVSTVFTSEGGPGRGTMGQRTGLAFTEKNLRQEFGATSGASYKAVGTDVYVKRGEAISQSMVQGVAIGAGTQSPSKKTIPIGEDIARGLEVGMQNRADDVANVGASVASGATRAMGRGVRTLGPITPGTDFPTEKTQGGVSVSQVANAAIISEATKKSANDMVASTKSFQDRMTGLNRGIMGSTFALGSLSGLASMSGGKIGEFAGIISKLNLAMFALMSVTQMLTQTQFTALAAKRIELAKGAVKMAKSGAGIAAMPGLVGKSGFAGSIARATLFVGKFLGPIGLATAAVGALALGFKVYQNNQEKTRLAVEGLGDAADLTKSKLKVLGDVFGVVPTENPMLQTAPQVRMTSERRGKVEELKANESFQKEFSKDIEELRKATNKEAELAFKSMALSLSGQGFAPEMIKNIIDALREEAGKTDVKVDLKSLDLKTEEGVAGFAQLAADITNELAVAAKNGYKEVTVLNGGINEAGQRYSYYAKELKPTVALQRAADASGQNLFNMFTGLAGQLKSGAIGAKEFNQGFVQIEAALKAVGESSPGTSLLILKSAIKSLEPETQKLFEGLKKDADMMLMLRAQALGLTAILPGLAEALKAVNEGYQGDATYLVQQQQLLEKYMKMIDSAAKKTEDFIKKVLSGKTGGGDGDKSPFQLAIEQLQEQQTELINTQKAYAKLRKEGIETGRAFEIASNSILAAAVANTKVGTKNWKELLGLIKNVNKELLSSELLKFFEERTAELDLKKQFAEILPLLEGLGLKTEDIKEILSNPDLARAFIEDLQDGVLKSEELAKYIKQIEGIKKVDIVIGISTEEDAFAALKSKADELFGFLERAAQREYKTKIIDAEKEVEAAQAAVDGVQSEIDKIEKEIESLQRTTEMEISRKIEDFQKDVSKLQREIELNFERPIEELNKQINSIEKTIESSFDTPIAGLQAEIEKMQRSIEMGFERPIAALQEEASDLSNELELMDRAAQQINDKYDAQEEALSKISEINQEISAQQKSQLSIADALTQGDISAAAQAAQEARAQAAAAASERASGTIDAARQAQLEALRTRQGMTRVQVEERQFAISQQVFNLEEDREEVQARILVKQDAIYNLEQSRIPLQEQIRIKQTQIAEKQLQQELIQKNIRDIEDKIYLLEKDREKNLRDIRDLEDKVYKIKVGQLAEDNKLLDAAKKKLEDIKAELQARLDNIDAQKDAWQAAADAQIAAAIAAEEYNDVLEATEEYLKRILELQLKIATAAQSATIGGASTATSGTPKITPATIVEKEKEKNENTEKIDKNTEKIDENTKKITEEIKTLTTLRKETESGTAINFLLKEHIDTLNHTLTTRSAPAMVVDERTQFKAKAAAAASIPKPVIRGGGNGISNYDMLMMAGGGLIKPKYMAVGGLARGSDKIPAMLAPGEFVMSKYAVSNYGVDKLKAMNNGEATSEGVYNYSINVNVKSGANPDEIAKSVMTQIKQIDSQRIRGQRV